MKKLLPLLVLSLILLAHNTASTANNENLPSRLVQSNFNYISLSSYNGIRVNNVLLKDIKAFKGEFNDLETLFGASFSVLAPDPEARNFDSDNLGLAYGKATSDWVLYHLEILNSEVTLHILGKEVKIGDNITILGLGTKLITMSTSPDKESAVFKTEYDDSYIAIEFDVRSNSITGIEYISPI